MLLGKVTTLDVQYVTGDLIEINEYGFETTNTQLIVWNWEYNQDTKRIQRKALTWYVSDHLHEVPVHYINGRYVMRFNVRGRQVVIGGKSFCRSRTPTDIEVADRRVWHEIPPCLYSTGD